MSYKSFPVGSSEAGGFGEPGMGRSSVWKVKYASMHSDCPLEKGETAGSSYCVAASHEHGVRGTAYGVRSSYDHRQGTRVTKTFATFSSVSFSSSQYFFKILSPRLANCIYIL